MDLQRANQWAGIGSFLVGVIGLVVLLYPLVYQPPPSGQDSSPPKQDPQVQHDTAGPHSRLSRLEWVGIGLIVVAMVAGGTLHLLAARQFSASRGVQPKESASVHAASDTGGLRPSIGVIKQPKAAVRPINGALLGELKWRVKTTEQAVFIEVTNDHVRDEPKRDIVVRVDDLRRWIEEKLAYVAVEEVVGAKPPFELQLAGGRNEVFYGGQQLYAFLPRTDQRGILQFNYRRKEAAHYFRIRKGTWRATVTVSWSDRAETKNVCFRVEKPSTTPEIVECPVELMV